MNKFASFGILLRKDETTTPSNTFIDEKLPTPHLAAAKGDVDLLASTVKEDPNRLEERSHDGLTPLAQAVQCQQLKSVRKLIQMGADINAQDNIGRTCLSVAAYQGWHEGVRCLLHNGAKRDIADNSGRTPLHAATYHSDTNTLSILLNSMSFEEINQPDNELMTAVHWAAFHDRPDHLMQLIQKKADVYARDIDGKLPLHWAAQNGSFQCVHRLTSLPEGLSTVNDLDNSGKSPAHYAAAAGAANIITILSHCDNIDLEIEDPDERTPLHWAAAMGHGKAAETLLKLGVNPFMTDVDGSTPLEYAKQSEFPDCLKVMEACLGKRSGRMSFGILPVSGKGGGIPVEEKYRYRKLATPPPPELNNQIVPDIKVLPPTTNQTQTKTTTNKTPVNPNSGSGRDRPRMYSASTDTDVLEFSFNASNKKPHHQHHRQPHHHNQTPPNGAKDQKVFSIGDHSNMFSQLVSSSFLAGAHGPILSGDHSAGDNKDSMEITEGPWAQRSGNNRPLSTREKEQLELKMMTSQNTPDLNRVSVNSFRSIPPLISQDRNDGSQTPRGKLTHEVEANRKELELPPLTSCGTTPRKGDDSWHSVTKPTATTTKQVTASRLPPHDFMTDNNAETRILTRMLRSTLGKVGYQPQQNPHHPLHSAGDKDSNKKTSGHPTNPSVLQNKRTKEERPAVHTKHSRIPSTRVISNSTQGSSSLMAANMAAPTRSPSGIFLGGREKYLDEDVTKPISPTPLYSIHLGGSGRGKGDKHSELPDVHKSKSKSKNASKSRNALEKLSNRYGDGGAKIGGGGGGVPITPRKETTKTEETTIKMPPIHKEGIQKKLRRVRHERKIQVAFS